jgi:polysaccharide biosynthesis transport protein
MRNTQSPPDDIDLASLGRAARKALPKIALLSLLAGGLTAGVMTQMLPRYASTATVEIVSRAIVDPNNPNAATDPNTIRETTDKEAVNTHVRKLLSTDLTSRMNKELGLAQMPEFNERLPASDTFTRLLQSIGLVKAKPNETDDDRVFASYAKSMKVAQVRESRNILIEFTTSDPKFSATGANKLAEIYRDSLTVSRKDETSDAVTKLDTEVVRLTREVALADKAVSDMRSKTDTIRSGTGGDRSLKEVQLGELTTELSKASGVRSEAEARAGAAKEQMARGTAESNPDVQKSQIIPRLSEQRVRLERQVSELAATLMPAHPRMKQVQGDLGALKRQITDEVRKIVDSLDKDAKIAIERERTLQVKINDIKKTVVTAAPDDVLLKGLDDTAKAKRTELERVQRALNTAKVNVTTGGAPVEVKIVQRALPMNEKIWPKPAFFGPLVALALMLVGLAWSVTRAIVSGPRGSGGDTSGGNDTTLKLDAHDVPATQPLAAAQQISSLRSTAAAATTLEEPTVTAVTPNATIASIGATLLQRDTSSACRTLVTGDRPGVDAAKEAVALAKSLAVDGMSVVLVDWANGGSSLADLTGGAASPGIAQLIQGEAAFEDVLQKLADTEAQFVPAGDALSEPTLVFDADRANLVLDALDEEYNHVIVYGAHQSAHALFEATQGRFDVGVTVSDGAAVANGAGSSFLGFEVADMAIFQIERRPAAASAATGARRFGATRAPRPTEARA